jgi:hypothetical protein
MNKDDQDIPELKLEQLGQSVRGKYFQRFMQGSNLVILQPSPAPAEHPLPKGEGKNTAHRSHQPRG